MNDDPFVAWANDISKYNQQATQIASVMDRIQTADSKSDQETVTELGKDLETLLEAFQPPLLGGHSENGLDAISLIWYIGDISLTLDERQWDTRRSAENRQMIATLTSTVALLLTRYEHSQEEFSAINERFSISTTRIAALEQEVADLESVVESNSNRVSRALDCYDQEQSSADDAVNARKKLAYALNSIDGVYVDNRSVENPNNDLLISVSADGFLGCSELPSPSLERTIESIGDALQRTPDLQIHVWGYHDQTPITTGTCRARFPAGNIALAHERASTTGDIIKEQVPEAIVFSQGREKRYIEDCYNHTDGDRRKQCHRKNRRIEIEITAPGLQPERCMGELPSQRN